MAEKRTSCITRAIDELFAKTPAEKRCPCIRKDEEGPYCAKGLGGGEPIDTARRYLCDVRSLQTSCLNERGFKTCMLYSEEVRIG